jgi:ribonuclease BN (tRNA processing enzyme)
MSLRPLLGFILILSSCQVPPALSKGKGVEVQVLGSGGPEMQTRRASCSYLIWIEGKARVLIDAGGGSALRFGEAGAVMADLDVILFTHFHADHSADFPALVKSSYFEDRVRPLPIFGPPGNEFFPSTTAFVQALFGEQQGAFRYLSDFLGSEGGYRLEPQDIEPASHEIRQVFSRDGISISAMRVTHGSVPSLAWRVEVEGKSVVFSGDTNGGDGNLEKLAKDADLFVAHNAVPEGETGVARRLHMPPSVIGQIAKAAAVKRLLLSHRMLRTLGRESDTLKAIQENYQGSVAFANDLDRFALQ